MTHSIQFKNVTKAFEIKVGGQTQVNTALDGVSFDIGKGEIVALAGPSGCGKTTALRIIMGLETASSGSVLASNKEVTGCGSDDDEGAAGALAGFMHCAGKEFLSCT